MVGGNLMTYFVTSFNKFEQEGAFEKKKGRQRRKADLDWQSRFQSEEDSRDSCMCDFLIRSFRPQRGCFGIHVPISPSPPPEPCTLTLPFASILFQSISLWCSF